MHQIIIKETLCVGCGLCKSDCVAENIIIENKKASILREHCLFCGHCEAICPRGAITLTGFTDEPQNLKAQIRLNPEELMQAIKTRRSVRKFREEAIPKEVIGQIIEAGRLAPTGSNMQHISYYVLDEKKEAFEQLGVECFRKEKEKASPLATYLENMTVDDHFFFKGGQTAIVVASDDTVDAALAAENMAFMAEAHGLGVLYSGFFCIFVNGSEKAQNLLGLKPNYKAIATLVLGYPAVEYCRTVRREDPDVTYL